MTANTAGNRAKIGRDASLGKIPSNATAARHTGASANPRAATRGPEIQRHERLREPAAVDLLPPEALAEIRAKLGRALYCDPREVESVSPYVLARAVGEAAGLHLIDDDEAAEILAIFDDLSRLAHAARAAAQAAAGPPPPLPRNAESLGGRPLFRDDMDYRNYRAGHASQSAPQLPPWRSQFSWIADLAARHAEQAALAYGAQVDDVRQAIAPVLASGSARATVEAIARARGPDLSPADRTQIIAEEACLWLRFRQHHEMETI